MIKNEQSSSTVYGVFTDDEERGYDLLGIYFLEGEAEAARQAYVIEAASRTKYNAEAYTRMLAFWDTIVVVRPIPVGRPAKKDPFLD